MGIKNDFQIIVHNGSETIRWSECNHPNKNIEFTCSYSEGPRGRRRLEFELTFVLIHKTLRFVLNFVFLFVLIRSDVYRSDNLFEPFSNFLPSVLQQLQLNDVNPIAHISIGIRQPKQLEQSKIDK